MCGRVTDVPKEDEDMHSEENFREDASGADRDPPTSSHGRTDAHTRRWSVSQGGKRPWLSPSTVI